MGFSAPGRFAIGEPSGSDILQIETYRIIQRE
jgi:hypothetical protein